GDARATTGPPAPAALPVAPAGPTVGDGHFDAPVGVAHEDLGPLRARVLDRVRQALLDEPVGGQVDPGRQPHRVALDPQLDRQPRLARVLDQPLELLEARLGRQCRSSLGVTQHAGHPPHPPRRILASAAPPVCSTTIRASLTRSWSCSSRRRTAEACTGMTLTLWPTTSWSSRAIRARSSATALRARSSRSRSARAARAFASST